MSHSETDGRGSVKPLEVAALRTTCDPSSLDFETTDELEVFEGLIGQDRALNAMRFGANIERKGFNLFALGPQGAGRHTAVRTMLESKARDEPPPDDWVYVNNFETPHKPRAIRLASGVAVQLRDAMTALIDDLAVAIPALFESEDYRNRRRALDEEFESANEDAFEDLKNKAQAQDIAILRTPMGFALAPVKEGEVIKPEEFNTLSAEDRAAIQAKIESLQKDLEKVLQQLPKHEKERRDKIRKLNAELAGMTVGLSIQDVVRQFDTIEAVKAYLGEVKKDLIDNAQIFLEAIGGGEEAPFSPGPANRLNDPRFRRYAVNVVVANGEHGSGAPIVVEEHPTLANLVGRVEHQSQMGNAGYRFHADQARCAAQRKWRLSDARCAARAE